MGDNIKGDLSFIDTRFWTETEPEFYILLDKLNKILKKGLDTLNLKSGLKHYQNILKYCLTVILSQISWILQIQKIFPKRIKVCNFSILKKYKNCTSPTDIITVLKRRLTHETNT